MMVGSARLNTGYALLILHNKLSFNVFCLVLSCKQRGLRVQQDLTDVVLEITKHYAFYISI